MLETTWRKGNLPTLLVGKYMEKSMEVHKKVKIELPYYPAISVLGIYLDKIIIPKDMCTPVFIATLFRIAKTWKHHKHPLTGE